MAIRKVTIQVDAVNGRPGLSSCGCSGDGTGSRLVMIPRDPTVIADGSGVIKGVVVGTPRSFKSAITGVLKYTVYEVEYDDALLTNPEVPLAGCDLLYNCCEGCEITYIDRKLAQFCGKISFTEVDDGVIVFQGCEGSPQSFQLGVGVLGYAESGCTGVGPDYALKSANITGNVLNLASAKLQDSNFGAGAAGENPISVNVSNIGTYARSGDGIQLDITIPPLSDCNEMTLFYALDADFIIDVASGWIGTLQVQGKKDAGVFGTFSSKLLEAVGRRHESIGYTGHGVHIIPANTSVSFSFYPQVVTSSAAATSTFLAWGLGFRAIVVNRKA